MPKPSVKKFLANDALIIFDWNLLVASMVDQPRIVLLVDAWVTSGLVSMETVATKWGQPHMPNPNTVPRYFARVPPDKWQHTQLISARQPDLPPSLSGQDTQGPLGASPM